MDDAEPSDEHVTEVDGVEVRKYLDDETFRFHAVVYEFVSAREEPVTVTVEESIPPDRSRADFEFPAEHGAEHWEGGPDGLAFEYELEPEADYRTAYGLSDGVAADDVDEPDAVSVDPAVDGDGSADPDAAATTDSPPTGVDSAGEAESVVDRFARELERGTPAAESLAVIEEQLGGGPSGSVDARLDQLQRDISDLRAYTDALETFLDEHGTGADLIDDLVDRQDAVEGDVDAVESAVGDLSAEMESLSATVDGLDDDLAAVSTELSDLTEEVEALGAEIERLEDRVPDYNVDDRFADVEDELTRIDEFIDRLQTAFE